MGTSKRRNGRRTFPRGFSLSNLQADATAQREALRAAPAEGSENVHGLPVARCESCGGMIDTYGKRRAIGPGTPGWAHSDTGEIGCPPSA